MENEKKEFTGVWIPRHVIEDNNLSVCTDTRKIWNIDKLPFEPEKYQIGNVFKKDKIWYYKYKMTKYKHAGTGKRIQF